VRVPAAIAVLVLLAGCGSDGGSKGGAAGGFDGARAFRDVRAQVRIGPRPTGSAGGRAEVRLISGRLAAAGVRDVRVQRPYRNVVARIPGDAPGTVVLAAHHDTEDLAGFVGANDGASGVAVLLELARALPQRLDGPSVDLVFFDAEEARPGHSFEADGTRGSRQFVRFAREGGRQGSPALGDVRAMVLFDMVGDCDLRIPPEANSSQDLYGAFAASDPRVFSGPAWAILDDHIPFVKAGIPSLDLIDFDYGPGPSPGAWWHTPRDDLSHVCARSLAVVGRAALDALPRIG
jgi:Zn-dependent M28 family amino/carboxypeptidase